ncbi:hypothetical protein Nepgr_007918 [Nepenthes gracilis]|uniref:Uncharacterized protein n=1 Tax=Nepenthes gracilis TaxID=150966 RepID=A0AAD3S7R2_NEPGR|nr:hypothetical protein Nepgr_007918 [Nepenthes gracilis]
MGKMKHASKPSSAYSSHRKSDTIIGNLLANKLSPPLPPQAVYDSGHRGSHRRYDNRAPSKTREASQRHQIMRDHDHRIMSNIHHLA